MKLTISKIHLQNFKGCADRTIEFKGNTKIFGQNGSGKSTLASAVSWLMTDTDYNLVKNPNVVPLGKSECEIKVEVEFELDGKPLEVSKSQKYKEKEDITGKVVSSVTNTYTINSVNKSYKDFVSDMESRGIDMENYLVFSNPNYFLADTSKSGREKARKILFNMATSISDEDVAKEIGADDLLKMMSEKGYTLEECKASAKATHKKIVDENGRNNEIINGKIDGMLSSKSQLDEAVLKEQKKSYEAEIERIDKRISDLSSGKSDITNRLNALRDKEYDLKKAADIKLNEKKTDYDKQIRELSRTIDENNFQLEQEKSIVSHLENNLSQANDDIKKQRMLYKIEQDAILDEGDLVCPTCHRTYDKSKLTEIKSDFEQNKTNRLKVIKASGESLKTRIAELETEIKEKQPKVETLEKLISDTKERREKIQTKLDALPLNADMSKNKEYVKVHKEIEELEIELHKDDTKQIEELESQRNVNRQMLNQIIGEMGVLKQNKTIDANVAELRNKRKSDEVTKAKMEKILSQVDDIEMAKNNKLSESINKHFKLIDFVLFKRLKNGTIEPTIEVMLDGKPLSNATNGSHILLGKLDVLEGLSTFFEAKYPVFIDDAALITDNVSDQITLTSQTILLIAKSGVKELEVAYEE